MNETLRYYNQNAAAFALNTTSVDFHETQDLFLSLLPQGAEILDFGCGAGRDTKYFLSKGFRVTAVDGSAELCRMAAEFTGAEVRQLLFQELEDVDRYDAVWACSSILHVKKAELGDIVRRISCAVHPGGVIYTSFKYGTFEGMRGERYFTDFEEASFQEFISNFPMLSAEKLWITNDVRPERRNERWLNIILRRSISG